MGDPGTVSGLIRKGWETAAHAYKEGIGPQIEPVSVHLSEVLRAVLAPPVLDLACGPGTALRHVWRDDPGFSGFGCDFSREMVKIARGRVRGAGGIVADQDLLPFAAESFMTVVSSMGTIFSSDPGRQIDEVARILKPGGVYGFSAWGRAEECELRGVSETVIQGWPHPYEGWIPPLESPYSSGRTSWLESVSARAGLRIDRVESGSVTFRFPDRDSAARALLGTGRFALLLRNDPDRPDRGDELVERTRAAFTPHADPYSGVVLLTNRYHLFVLARNR
ncbi:MAG: class I SAM-dependent methyltransferase [Leptospirales bacterium]